MKEFWEYFVKNVKIVIADLKSKDKERRRKQIPNTLTLIRGFLAPVTIIPAVLTNHIYLAFLLIALCGLTDCFDGWYARTYNAQSEFGADLDAICDKLFVLTLTFPLFKKFPFMSETFIPLDVTSICFFNIILKAPIRTNPKNIKVAKNIIVKITGFFVAQFKMFNISSYSLTSTF